MSKKILVLGATGIMGKRVISLANRLLPEVEVFKACRNTPSNDLSFHQVNIFDKTSLSRAIQGINLVINTVGPFYYDPTLLLKTCFDVGCHYIDLAETSSFIEQVKKTTLSSINNIHSYVVTGCSTVPAMIEVFIQNWVKDFNIEKINAFLAMGSSNEVSKTLIYSLLRPLGTASPQKLKYFSRLTEKYFTNLGKRVYGNYPSAFDLTGLCFGSKTIPLDFYAGFDKPIYSYLLFMLAKALPLFSDKALMKLSQVANLFTPIIQVVGSQTGILLIEKIGKENKVLNKVEIRANHNGLDIPALPAVWVTEKLLNNNFANKLINLSDLFSSQEMTNLLLKEGYEVYGNSTN